MVLLTNLKRLTQPEILIGCLDFLLEWEPDLLAFADYANIAPETPMQARQVLMGEGNDSFP